MNTSHTHSRRAGRGPTEFPPLLYVLGDQQLYPVLRALVAGDITKPVVPRSNFTSDNEGHNVAADEEKLKTVIGSIGVAIGSRRLRATPQRLRGSQGQLTLSLSPVSKQKLLVELIQLLGNISGQELECSRKARVPT